METGKAECDQFPYALPEACFGQDVVDGDGRVGSICGDPPRQGLDQAAKAIRCVIHVVGMK